MNTIIYGFNLTPKVIHKLINNKIISKKLWIGGRKNTYADIRTVDIDNLRIPSIKHSYVKEYDQFFNDNFLKFTEYFSRKHSVDFTLFEFKNTFNIYFYYFYYLLKDIDLILFSTIPHYGFEFLMYKMAKEIFNIRTVIFYQSLFPNKMWYLEEIEDYGTFINLKNLNNPSITNIKIDNTYKKNLFYMNNINKKSFKNSCLYKHLIKDLSNSLNIFDNTKQREILGSIKKFVKCNEYKNLNKYFSDNIDLSQKFVYFPLHMQPELTSSVLAGKYSDQLLAIEKISRLIPNDWKIYVKENPKQTFFQRDKYFFERLMNIEKTVLVSRKVNTYDLLKHSQFPATLTGTVGWESITGGKPVLIFGNAWYKTLHGVIKYNDTLNIENILNIKIDHETLVNEVNNLISYCFNGIVDKDYITLYKSYSQKENEQNIYNAVIKVLND